MDKRNWVQKMRDDRENKQKEAAMKRMELAKQQQLQDWMNQQVTTTAAGSAPLTTWIPLTSPQYVPTPTNQPFLRPASSMPANQAEMDELRRETMQQRDMIELLNEQLLELAGEVRELRKRFEPPLMMIHDEVMVENYEGTPVTVYNSVHALSGYARSSLRPANTTIHFIDNAPNNA